MHTLCKALACSGACECGSRRTLAGGMIESAHGERAKETVSMRPCSASCCVREGLHGARLFRCAVCRTFDLGMRGDVLFAGELPRKITGMAAAPSRFLRAGVPT